MLEKEPKREYGLIGNVAEFLLNRLVRVPYVMELKEHPEQYEQLTLDDFRYTGDEKWMS